MNPPPGDSVGGRRGECVELSTEQLLNLYRLMVRSRAFDQMAISQVQAGRIPGSWMSGIGQEKVGMNWLGG